MHDDEKAIIDLTIAYTWALDERRFDDLRTIFAADATAELAGVHCDGIEAIIARIRGALMKVDASQHVISNQQVRNYAPLFGSRPVDRHFRHSFRSIQHSVKNSTAQV